MTPDRKIELLQSIAMLAVKAQGSAVVHDHEEVRDALSLMQDDMDRLFESLPEEVG